MKLVSMLLRVVLNLWHSLHSFRLSLEEGIFPEDLKTAKVTPILRLVMKMTLVTIHQSLFYLVFPK